MSRNDYDYRANERQLDEINALKAEIERLKQDLDRLSRGTWSIEIARQSKITSELRAELNQLRAATQLCDKHAPKGGTVAACVICSGQKLSYALSRISYLCEPPNEMEFSSYDLRYNEDAVVAQVERLRKDVKEGPR